MARHEGLVIRGVFLGAKTPSDVYLKGGLVARIEAARRGKPDLGSRTSIIAPTLFDIQVNGLGGIDLQGTGVVPEDVKTITDRLAASGVSHWIPTLITASQRDMEHGCKVIVEALQDRAVAQAVPGVHLEGPYISPLDGPRGAHSRRHVRKPSLREFDRFMEAAGGRIAYITVAAEINGIVPFIKSVVSRGVVVSLGHQSAGPDAIMRAVDAGATLSTHLGNGVATMIPRHLNPIWPQLADDRLACSLIADLEHLPPEVLRVFVRAKGPERVILTSDVVHLAGLIPGKYTLGGVDVELRPGRICLTGTDMLAGSAATLLEGVVNAATVTDMTLDQAFASATTVPARVLGLPILFELARVGQKAGFVVFDIAGAGARRPVIRAAFVNGERKA